MHPVLPIATLSIPFVLAAFADGQAGAPSFAKVVPNVLVSDMERSIAFYRAVLGFSLDMTVPDQAPYVFASMKRGAVEIFLNDAATATHDFPALEGKPLGGTNTMYVKLDAGIEAYHDQIKSRTTVVFPFTKQPYGMTEFAVTDPDGYVIFFAQEQAR